MKRLLSGLLICVMATSLFACNSNSGNASPSTNTNSESGSDGTTIEIDKRIEGDVARVDDEIITSDQVTEYMTLIAFLQDSSLDDVTDDSTMYYVMDMVLENMTEQKVLEHYLKAAGKDILSDPIRKGEYENFKTNVLKAQDMKTLYDEGKLTDEGIEFIYNTQYLSEDFYGLIKEEKNYSEDELQRYYNDHQADMERTIVDAAHIMVTDLALAEEIHDRLVNEGADFAKLAAEYSVDINTKDNGGELGEFGKNETLPAFEEAVFGMEIGDVSEPIMTDLGYHIIKLNNKYKRLLDFEVCKSYIEDLLVSNDCSELMKELKENNIEYLYDKE